MIQVTDDSGWIILVDPSRLSYVARHGAGGMWPEKKRHVIDLFIDIGEPFKIVLDFNSEEDADAMLEHINRSRQ